MQTTEALAGESGGRSMEGANLPAF